MRTRRRTVVSCVAPGDARSCLGRSRLVATGGAGVAGVTGKGPRLLAVQGRASSSAVIEGKSAMKGEIPQRVQITEVVRTSISPAPSNRR